MPGPKFKDVIIGPDIIVTDSRIHILLGSLILSYEAVRAARTGDPKRRDVTFSPVMGGKV